MQEAKERSILYKAKLDKTSDTKCFRTQKCKAETTNIEMHNMQIRRKFDTLPLPHGNTWAVPKSLLRFCNFIIIVPEIKTTIPI